MNFIKRIKGIGSIDVDEILKSVKKISEDEWNADLQVQHKFPKTHLLTRMVKIYWPGDVNDGSTGQLVGGGRKYMDVITSVLDELRSFYGDGRPSRAMFAKLRVGMSINRHRDIGGALVDSHRTHTPLQTNKDVEFIIDGERCEMKVGEIYEINNQLKHEVHNNGSVDRIHLIVDWHVPGEYRG